MPKRLCRAAGCPNYRLDGHDYCEKHLNREVKFGDGLRASPWNHLYHTSEWSALKRSVLKEQPYCSVCGEPSTEVHHIIPHRGDEELFYDRYNLIALCHNCHSRETMKEIKERNNKRSDDQNNETVLPYSE